METEFLPSQKFSRPPCWYSWLEKFKNVARCGVFNDLMFILSSTKIGRLLSLMLIYLVKWGDRWKDKYRQFSSRVTQKEPMASSKTLNCLQYVEYIRMKMYTPKVKVKEEVQDLL
jgi:hypothetical protein